MTTQNVLARLEAEQHEIRRRVAQVNGETERDGLQTHAGAVNLELGA